MENSYYEATRPGGGLEAVEDLGDMSLFLDSREFSAEDQVLSRSAYSVIGRHHL